jgi:hypothetical protein
MDTLAHFMTCVDQPAIRRFAGGEGLQPTPTRLVEIVGYTSVLTAPSVFHVRLRTEAIGTTISCRVLGGPISHILQHGCPVASGGQRHLCGQTAAFTSEIKRLAEGMRPSVNTEISCKINAFYSPPSAA